MQTFKDENGVEYNRLFKQLSGVPEDWIIIIPKQKEIPEWEKYGFTTDKLGYIAGYNIEGCEMLEGGPTWKSEFIDGVFFPTKEAAERRRAQNQLILEAKERGLVKKDERFWFHWQDMYCASNCSVVARYGGDQAELIQFHNGDHFHTEEQAKAATELFRQAYL